MSMKREITAGTVATILGTVLLPVVFWFSETIGNFCIAIWRWLFSQVSVPWWLLLITSGLSLFLIGAIVIALIQHGREQDASEHSMFKEMEFSGFLWRWGWRNGFVVELTPYCPSCDRMARYAEEGAFRRDPRTRLFCKNCSHVNNERVGTFDELKNDVDLEIEHSVRTGKWKRLVDREMQTKCG